LDLGLSAVWEHLLQGRAGTKWLLLRLPPGREGSGGMHGDGLGVVLGVLGHSELDHGQNQHPKQRNARGTLPHVR